MKPKELFNRWLRFDLIARCAILAQATTTATLGWFVPSSLTARLLEEGGGYGQTILIMFSVVLVLSILDVVVNDFLPARIMWHVVQQNRHKLYHFLAALYFIQAYAGVGKTLGVEDFLPFSYLATGMVAAWYSVAISMQGRTNA